MLAVPALGQVQRDVAAAVAGGAGAGMKVLLAGAAGASRRPDPRIMNFVEAREYRRRNMPHRRIAQVPSTSERNAQTVQQMKYHGKRV